MGQTITAVLDSMDVHTASPARIYIAERWNPIEGRTNNLTTANIDRLRELLEAEES